LSPLNCCVPDEVTIPAVPNAASATLITGVVVPVATDIAPVPLTLVTVPAPPVYCGIFNVEPTNVDAPLVPVVVSVSVFCFDANLDVRLRLVVSENANLLLNVVQSVDVKYPLLPVVALNNSITGVLVVFVIDNGLPTVTDAVTLVTVPAPISLRKLTAVLASTVLSALKRGKVMAEGFVKVNIDCPMVVPPKLVLPVAATSPVLPPSHFNLSV
jgi:hypothetical protein